MSEVLRLDRPKILWVPSDVAISCEMPQLLLEGQNHQNPVASVMFQKKEHWRFQPTPTKRCSTEIFCTFGHLEAGRFKSSECL